MFVDKLNDGINETSPICVGLDPTIEKLPPYLLKDYSVANATLRFCEEIIDSVSDLCPIIKPQMAYFENMGIDGINALKDVIEYAHNKGLLVLLDGKRNDISTTAEAYAKSYLEKGAELEADALTVSPYLGFDGIKPFSDYCSKNKKGLFILVKTSNPSSGDIQDLKLENGDTVYEHVAKLVSSWGEEIVSESGYSSIGAVVGATYPEQAAKIRQLLPRQIFLVPGFGAQGGTAKDVKPCFNSDKKGAIINSSRGIIYAYQKREDLKAKDFALASRDATVLMKNELEEVLNN